jgi:outer membrane protein OmpA-like peptidoglycan-associated protein
MALLDRIMTDLPWQLVIVLSAMNVAARATPDPPKRAAADSIVLSRSACANAEQELAAARDSFGVIAREVTGGVAMEDAPPPVNSGVGASREEDPWTRLLRDIHSHRQTVSSVSEFIATREIKVVDSGKGGIRFALGSARLDVAGSQAALDEVCEDVAQRVERIRNAGCALAVEAEGHTCMRPVHDSIFDNVPLSLGRAMAVASWLHESCLQKRGYEVGRDFVMTARGAGPWTPTRGDYKDPNNRTDEDQMRSNRRVVLRFLRVACRTTGAGTEGSTRQGTDTTTANDGNSQ